MLDLYVRPTIPFNIRCETEKISRKDLIAEISNVSEHLKYTNKYTDLQICSDLTAQIFLMITLV